MIGKILDRIFVVCGALVFLQLPLFMNQYQLQLTGHVSELKFQIQTIEKVAEKSGKTLDQYIQKFVENEDKDFSTQGFVMKKANHRFHALSLSLEKLQSAYPAVKPFLFMYYAQWDIVKSTWHLFEPGLTFSSEALYYAFLGILFGYLVFTILSRVGKFLFMKKTS